MNVCLTRKNKRTGKEKKRHDQVSWLTCLIELVRRSMLSSLWIILLKIKRENEKAPWRTNFDRLLIEFHFLIVVMRMHTSIGTHQARKRERKKKCLPFMISYWVCFVEWWLDEQTHHRLRQVTSQNSTKKMIWKKNCSTSSFIRIDEDDYYIDLFYFVLSSNNDDDDNDNDVLCQ